MALETPSRPPPPPFMANAILNFHFDYLTPSLNNTKCALVWVVRVVQLVKVEENQMVNAVLGWSSVSGQCGPGEQGGQGGQVSQL